MSQPGRGWLRFLDGNRGVSCFLHAARTLQGMTTPHAPRFEIDGHGAKAAIFNLNRITSQPNELEESWIIYSRRQYLCFTERQDFETTVRQRIAAFEHLGGVATVCLYDNMKVVVTRWEDGPPIHNTRFLSFATHYGFQPWVCRVRRRETKGEVERSFHYLERNLLNGRTSRTLEHLNEVARWWVTEVNDRHNKQIFLV